MKKWILPITLFFVIAVIVLATYRAGSDKIQIVYEESHPETRVTEKPLLPTPTPENLNNPEEQIKIDAPPSELHACVQIDPVTQTVEVTIALWSKNRQTYFQKKQFQVTGKANCVMENVQWPNTYWIIASASGFISSQQVAETYDDSIVFKLFTKPILELSVVSDSNATVPGAQIDIRSNSNGIYSSEQKTDDRGQLHMSLPFTGQYHLSVTHPLFNQSFQKNLDIYDNPNCHKIVMTNQTGWIFGHVYDENQKPAPQKNIAGAKGGVFFAFV